MGDDEHSIRHTIQRCLDGHPHDFRALVDRYGPALRIHLIRDLGPGPSLNGAAHPRPPAANHAHDLVDESVQETLVRAFFLLPRLREPDSFWSWLLGIGRRVLKEQQRARRRAGQTPLRLYGRSPASVAAGAAGQTAAAALESAVMALPDPYREVILLRFYAGLSCPVIAEQLGVPVGTVTKRLSRAYELLRDSLESEAPRRARPVPAAPRAGGAT